MVALLAFIIATLEKKMLDTKGPFGGNVLESSSLFLFLLSFCFVSVIFELIGPEKPAF